MLHQSTCIVYILSLFAINWKEMNLTNIVICSIGTRNKHRNSQRTTVRGVIKATPKSFIISCRCGGAERCSGTSMMSAHRLNVWLCYPRQTPEICIRRTYSDALLYTYHSGYSGPKTNIIITIMLKVRVCSLVVGFSW